MSPTEGLTGGLSYHVAYRGFNWRLRFPCEPAIPNPAYVQEHKDAQPYYDPSNSMAATHGLRPATWKQVSPPSPTPHTYKNTNTCTPKTTRPIPWRQLMGCEQLRENRRASHHRLRIHSRTQTHAPRKRPVQVHGAIHGLWTATSKQVSPPSPTPHTYKNTNTWTPKTFRPIKWRQLMGCEQLLGNRWARHPRSRIHTKTQTHAPRERPV